MEGKIYRDCEHYIFREYYLNNNIDKDSNIDKELNSCIERAYK